MLKELYVKNFAVIDDVNIQFTNGFNILSGETGAGKTLIIEAINLLIGERANLELIRDGKENLLVQGFFDFTANDAVIEFLLKENFIKNKTEAADIEITRELNKNGRNRIFINGNFSQVSFLKNLGNLFIDIHGQHEHQYLLDKKNHLKIIDKLGNTEIATLKESYRLALTAYNRIKSELDDLQEKQNQKDEFLYSLKLELNEIKSLKLKPGEDEELENEKNILKNYEKIYQYSTDCLAILNGIDNSDYSLIFNNSKLLKILIDFEKIDKNISRFISELESFGIIIDELNNYLNIFVQNLDFNPENLEKIQERLFHINEIKRKYNSDIPELIERANKLMQQIEEVEEVDDAIEKKSREFINQKEKLLEIAIRLSDARKLVSAGFVKQIEKELLELNFKSVTFKADITFTNGDDAELHSQKIKFNTDGIDNCEFLISLNPGEEPKSLIKIASGGEISRIMLALKSIIGRADNIQTIIFDEIDSGIGGQTALIVAEKLYKISVLKQVICITHLSQIASFADNHLLIEKYVEKNKTKIKMKVLNKKEKILEISRMMSGTLRSDLSIMHAEELINQSKETKEKVRKMF